MRTLTMRDRRLPVAASLLIVAGLLANHLFAQSAPALTPEQRTQFERWWEQQPTLNMPFDNNGAKVLIVEFTDLQCPHCRQKYLEIKPILDKYAGRPKDVTLLLKHWPISTGCNPGISANLHPSACDAAAAVVMARRKGTADALIDWFFTHQDEMTPATVRRAASEVGKIPDFDAQYARAIQEVKTDIALGSALGVNSTPSFFINGRRLPGGGLAAQYFSALLDLEVARVK
jgi:protein-disulfide isomerase